MPLAGTWLEGTRLDRGLALWRRIERVRFTAPTRFEIEVADKYRPGRRWLAALEMDGLFWRLTDVRVLRRAG